MCGVDHDDSKVVKSEGMSMPGGKVMEYVEEGGYKYLWILKTDVGTHEEMKDQIKIRIHQRSHKNTQVKGKWREYYLSHQFKAKFHCKIWSQNHKLDKDGTWSVK